MSDRSVAEDRAKAALIGGALGDALGMPTQLLSPAQIRETYGFVENFVLPVPDHPVSKGLPAGTITDDTEQALLLGQVLLETDDAFDHHRWVNALVEWKRDVKARGSYDLLGPSTKRAIDAINSGTPPEEAGRDGDTNGAAMRIAPVGIMMPSSAPAALAAKVAETCRATHNTSMAIASAAAVAGTAAGAAGLVAAPASTRWPVRAAQAAVSGGPAGAAPGPGRRAGPSIVHGALAAGDSGGVPTQR